MHKLIYRYWCFKKECWKHGKVEGSMEDIEEFLTQTEIDIDAAKLDGHPYPI